MAPSPLVCKAAWSGELSYGPDCLLWFVRRLPRDCQPVGRKACCIWYSVLGILALVAKGDLQAGIASGWPLTWQVLVGVIAGSVVGMVRVSGGSVLAPLFALCLGIPQQLAQGSSLVSRLPSIVGGVAENQREGAVCWLALPWLGLGIIVGTVLGGALAIYLPEHILRWLFAALLLLLGLHVIAGWPLHPHIEHRPLCKHAA